MLDHEIYLKVKKNVTSWATTKPAQTTNEVEFMLENVAYRTTVYKTGVGVFE